MYNISFAVPSDADALLAIYGEYIDTPVTFEYTLPSTDEFTRHIAEVSAFYPYLVCKKDGVPVGYAYAHRHKEREAYKWNAEMSVYIAKNERSHGIGRVLYNCIIDILRLQNIVNVYACITVPNDASEKFHAAQGFSRIDEFKHTGYKCGRWCGVCWYEKTIAEIRSSPDDPIAVGTLDCSTVAEIIKSGEASLNRK